MRRALSLLCAALAGLVFATPSAPADEDVPGLDYAYYKERISPIVMRLCGECHADPKLRRKVGRHKLRPAPGRRVRESHHRRNYETVAELVTPGNPAASLYLLKPLDPRQGGLTHKGGVRLNPNTPEYGALIDWINGATLPPVVWEPPPHEEGQPDFRFYVQKIAPVVHGECAECHAGKGFGKFKLVVPAPDEPFGLEDHHRNFRTILQLIEPGEPLESKFLRKPLPRSAGGLKHRGGDRFVPGDERHRAWTAFIEGEPGRPLPTGVPPATPRLTARGLTIQAERFAIGAELSETELEGADGTVIEAADGDGDMYVDLDVADPGVYTLHFRIQPGGPALRWSFDQAPMAFAADTDGAASDEQGFVEVGPLTLADGSAPLLDARGVVLDEGGALALEADGDRAGFLSPEVVRHTGVEARFRMPDERDGGDDALLLFDAIDGDNGKVCGLTDGGRRFVIGLLEGGRLRILDSAEAQPDREAVRRIRVRYFAGVAIGELDERPHVRMNLGDGLGDEGRFGFLTHGRATVEKLAAFEQFELHVVRAGAAPVVDVPRGRHRLWIELPQGAGALDRVRFAPTD
jgi:hypothetical protein